jgi:hypothetical protein
LVRYFKNSPDARAARFVVLTRNIEEGKTLTQNGILRFILSYINYFGRNNFMELRFAVQQDFCTHIPDDFAPPFHVHCQVPIKKINILLIPPYLKVGGRKTIGLEI